VGYDWLVEYGGISLSGRVGLNGGVVTGAVSLSG
jgi:hypothetical protein